MQNNAVKTMDRIEMLIEYLQRELADIRGMIGKRSPIAASDPPAAIHEENLAGSRQKAEDVAQQKLNETLRSTGEPPNQRCSIPTEQEMEEATRRASEPPEPGTAARERQAKKQPLPFGGAK